MEVQVDLFASVKFVRRFLSVAGHWPDRTLSVFTECRSFLSFTLATIFLVTNLIEIILHFDNFKDFAENMSVTATVFAFMVKLVAFKLKRQKFFKILDLVSSAKTFQPEENNHRLLVENMSATCIVIMKMYGAITVIVVSFYTIVALTSKKLPIKLTYDFGDWVYAVFTFQMVSITNVATNTVCLDMLALCFMGAAIAQLEVLESRIDTYVMRKEQRLGECVIHHNEIIELLLCAEDIFNIFFLSQYLGSIFSICNIGFQLANTDLMSVQFATMFFYFSGMMWQLAMFCWFGNEIILKSLAVGDACYKADWVESKHSTKSSLIIIMTRANIQLGITAAKFSVLSLRSLMSIMNASYSYFALMQRLYTEGQ